MKNRFQMTADQRNKALAELGKACPGTGDNAGPLKVPSLAFIEWAFKGKKK